MLKEMVSRVLHYQPLKTMLSSLNRSVTKVKNDEMLYIVPSINCNGEIEC